MASPEPNVVEQLAAITSEVKHVQRRVRLLTQLIAQLNDTLQSEEDTR